VKWYHDNEAWWRPLKDSPAVKLIELSIPGSTSRVAGVGRRPRILSRVVQGRGLPGAAGLDFHAQQANLSVSKSNVVRGLHYSIAPEGQAKVVTCAHGELDDVIVDIRVGSPTFGRCEVVHLAADEERSVLVPWAWPTDSASRARGGAHYLLSSPFNAART
jgi:dTDP-4-dehydrorhamnose 3,5-epimerase-like enzyme